MGAKRVSAAQKPEEKRKHDQTLREARRIVATVLDNCDEHPELVAATDAVTWKAIFLTIRDALK